MTKWLIGLVPAALAAVFASLVSLPLDSPDDALLNTGTVTIAALAVGIALAVVWQVVQSRPNGRLVYVGITAAGFVAAVVFVAICETQLSGMIEFGLPLTALVFAIAGVLTPLVASLKVPDRVALVGAPVSLVMALGLGIGLAGMGDGESGTLSLPESPSPTGAARVLTAADVAGVAFDVVPGESQLTYTVREKLALLPASSDAVGRTTDVGGEIFLDGTQSTVSADMSTLASDQDRRDGYVRDNIFNTDPIVTFVVDNLGGLAPPAAYVPGETFTGTLAGTVTIRGASKPLSFAVEANYDGNTLQVQGSTDFTWADFNITPPNIPNIVQVEDNVHIDVLVVARSPLQG